MTRDSIIEVLREILERHLGRSVEATLDSDVQRDLELDSLKQLAVIVEIENHFRISFEPEDDAVTTLGELIAVIERRLQEEAAND